MSAPNIETERLWLRQWKEEDLLPFAELNQDPLVMEFFPSTLSKEESDALAKKIQQELQEKDYGLWAIEIPNKVPFIGFIGLHYQDFEAPFTPCIEIGWRLASPYWGRGYATEGGKAVIDYAFHRLHLPEIVSFTFIHNWRSRKVMERLAMVHNPEEDFMHPKLPEDHLLRPHVLYRLRS